MTHPLRCRCGHLRGVLHQPEKGLRGVCYCRDCQAFAAFLGTPAGMLDAMAGSDVIAVPPQQLSFSQGQDKLACMSLSPQGMLRWYASCCNTPIGNTPRDIKMPHLGLLHSCLEDPSDPNPAAAYAKAFGPVRMVVNTQSAKGGKPQTMLLSTLLSVARFMLRLLRIRLNGSYRRNPFFDASSGAPIQPVQVLSKAQRERLTPSAG